MIPKPLEIGTNRQEITRSTAGFALICYSSDFSPTTYDYVDWHWHLEFQFCLVVNGEVCFQINDQQVVVRQGSGIFINSQQVHTARPHQCEQAAYFCVNIHPAMICSDTTSALYHSHVLPFLDNAELSAVPLFADEKNHQAIVAILSTLRTQFIERKPGYELELAMNALSLWKNMVQLGPDPGTHRHSSRTTHLKNMLDFIQNHYADLITLNAISAHVHLSRSECCRYFRKMTGQTLFNYVSSYRLDKSTELLIQSDLSICDIAQAVGFLSQSYYTQCFRKAKGMTPREYRKKQRP